MRLPRWNVTDWVFALLVGGPCAAVLTGCSGRPRLEPGFRLYSDRDRAGATEEVIGGGDVRMRR